MIESCKQFEKVWQFYLYGHWFLSLSMSVHEWRSVSVFWAYKNNVDLTFWVKTSICVLNGAWLVLFCLLLTAINQSHVLSFWSHTPSQSGSTEHLNMPVWFMTQSESIKSLVCRIEPHILRTFKAEVLLPVLHTSSSSGHSKSIRPRVSMRLPE